MSENNVKVSFPSQKVSDKQIITEYRIGEIIEKYYTTRKLEIMTFSDGDWWVFTSYPFFPFIMNNKIFSIETSRNELIIKMKKTNLSISDSKLMCEEFGKLFERDNVEVRYTNFPSTNYF